LNVIEKGDKIVVDARLLDIVSNTQPYNILKGGRVEIEQI